MSFYNKILGKNGSVKKTHDKMRLSKDININIANLKKEFGYSDDLLINYCKTDAKRDLNFVSVYFGDLVDRSTINSLSLELDRIKNESGGKKSEMGSHGLINRISGLRGSKEGFDYETLYTDLLSGNTVFLIDGCNRYFSLITGSDKGRSVEEPSSQTVIRGPKDGFTEGLSGNIALIRKRIRNKALRLEILSVGSITRTRVGLMFIDQIAKEEIVQEIRSRLLRIEIDGILESGYIEELIKDDRYSIFPSFLSSEKPDSVAAALLEGKVAILIDGTPYVLTAPALMVEFLHSSEDYYHHFIISSMMRILRFAALLLTLFVPALFVAFSAFHQEIIPTPLLINIAAQREGVPFPTLLEALLMELTFEVLREAGIRMPRAIGPAISIVGALVLGQAAVEAGIISAAMVIVVSITAISSFAIPNYEMSNAIRTIRFVFLLLAGFLGLYGVFMGGIALTLHLCKIKSITVPYLMPIAPRIRGGNKDTFFRFPLWKMEYRPAGISESGTARVNAANPAAPRKRGKQELR